MFEEQNKHEHKHEDEHGHGHHHRNEDTTTKDHHSHTSHEADRALFKDLNKLDYWQKKNIKEK